MNKRNSVLVVVGILVVVAFLVALGFYFHLFGGQAAQTLEKASVFTPAKIEIVSGQGSLKHPTEETYQLITGTHELTKGDSLRVGDSSKATIYWPDGSVSRLKGGTELVIQDLHVDEDDVSSQVEVELTSGEVWSKVLQFVDEDSQFSVKTSNSVSGVRGTTFLAAYDAINKTTRIDTFEHAVKVDAILSGSGAMVMQDSMMIIGGAKKQELRKQDVLRKDDVWVKENMALDATYIREALPERSKVLLARIARDTKNQKLQSITTLITDIHAGKGDSLLLLDTSVQSINRAELQDPMDVRTIKLLSSAGFVQDHIGLDTILLKLEEKAVSQDPAVIKPGQVDPEERLLRKKVFLLGDAADDGKIQDIGDLKDFLGSEDNNKRMFDQHKSEFDPILNQVRTQLEKATLNDTKRKDLEQVLGIGIVNPPKEVLRVKDIVGQQKPLSVEQATFLRAHLSDLTAEERLRAEAMLKKLEPVKTEIKPLTAPTTVKPPLVPTTTTKPLAPVISPTTIAPKPPTTTTTQPVVTQPVPVAPKPVYYSSEAR